MDKEKLYNRLAAQVDALLDSNVHWLSTLANFSALLNLELENINWVGFYLKHHDELILGPFQGNPACTNIEIGQGVCGTAVANKTTVRVENVHDFPGHIACDAASQSEIVLPLYANSQLVGVLDIDSPILNRFDHNDEIGLQKLIDQLANALPNVDF